MTNKAIEIDPAIAITAKILDDPTLSADAYTQMDSQHLPNEQYLPIEHNLHEPSTESSATASRRMSTDFSSSKPPGERHRVRFSPVITPERTASQTENPKVRSKSPYDRNRTRKPLPYLKRGPSIGSRSGLQSSSRPISTPGSADITDSPVREYVPRVQPLFSLGSGSGQDGPGEGYETEEEGNGEDVKAISQQLAYHDANELNRELGSAQPPSSSADSREVSQSRSRSASPAGRGAYGISLDMSTIPLENLQKRKKYGIEDDTESDGNYDEERNARTPLGRTQRRVIQAARKLIRRHSSPERGRLFRVSARGGATDLGLQSGQTTPTEDQGHEHVQRPKQNRRGILGNLLKLYEAHGIGSAIDHHFAIGENHHPSDRHPPGEEPLIRGFTPKGSAAATPAHSPPSSGATTPKSKEPKWHQRNTNRGSSASLSSLISSATLLSQSVARLSLPKQRPLSMRSHSSGAISTLLGRKKDPKRKDTIYIHIHIQEILLRQHYLIKLCRALMTYGAPTHRLEEYMRMSARVLQIEGQFLYMPGCMLISFDDPSTHTTEVKIVRSAQAVDLGKLQDMHDIYKNVVHDHVGVDQASIRLDELMQKKKRFQPWLLVFVYGLASAFVGPFAFEGRGIDMPIAFVLGSLLGFMQLILAPRSDLYSNVFEISAAVVTSFLARAFGSIANGNIFCFSALAQSSIALILPGYIVLSAALELQSRNIVAGSVRMVYAIIYSLFLGFGITIGTSFYGGIDPSAISEINCRSPMTLTRPFYAFWPMVMMVPFTLCLAVICQAKPRQMPAMIIFSVAGYVVNYFSALRFPSNVQVANALGAFMIGLLGNIYSRCFHGLSAAAIIPAIFVQVPSGLAASGSLISGVSSANQITKNKMNGTTTVANGTQAGTISHINVNSEVFNVGYSMIQIAIGITVGLFLSSLVIYPFGKRRSGLFSF